MFPACEARIAHVPVAASVTVLPATVQTDIVNDEKLTGRPDDAVALIVNGAAPSVRLPSAANVIV